MMASGRASGVYRGGFREKTLLLAAFLAVTDGKSIEPAIPLRWKDYEARAYTWVEGRMESPMNKPKSNTYWPISEWTMNWYKKKWAARDAARKTVPEYHVTPFITRDIRE